MCPCRTPHPRPTPLDRDNAAAWCAYQARISRRAGRMADAIVALAIGILLALALLHWATPCATGTLCLAGFVPLPAWWARTRRRWHARILHARLIQLLGTAQALACDQRPGTPLRLGAVLAKAAAARLALAELQRQDRAERAHHAATEGGQPW